MKLKMTKWSLITTFVGMTGLLVMAASVSGETEKDEAVKDAPVTVVQADVHSWSEKRTEYVKPSKAELRKRLTKLQYKGSPGGCH